MKVTNKILVLDSDRAVRSSIESILENEGYEIFSTGNAQKVFEILQSESVALIILDYHSITGDNLDYISKLQKKENKTEIILTCAYPDLSLTSDMVEKGIYDLVPKPFHAYQMLMSVRRVMEKHRLIVESKDFQRLLEKKIKEQTLSLRLRNQEKQQLLINTIKSLVQTLEAKDKYTEGHSRRVAENSLQIAQDLGVDYKEQEEIHLAGLLHDIGKIGIKESILHKRGRLTDEEYNHIKTHPLISQRILEPIPQFKGVVSMIRNHHEFYDGSGYPDGLSGKDIPAGARILAICDAFDAMTSDRPYRDALPEDAAYSVLARNAGTQFDPDLVKVFYKVKGRQLSA